jgi:hypothetical protein
MDELTNFQDGATWPPLTKRTCKSQAATWAAILWKVELET